MKALCQMTATLTMDESGQIALPEQVRSLFGLRPGVRLRAEVTADRIEIVKEVPLASGTTRSPSGRLVLAPQAATVTAAAAVREEREALANRAARR